MNGAWNGLPSTYHSCAYPDADEKYPDPVFQPDPRRFRCLVVPRILGNGAYSVLHTGRNHVEGKVAA